MTTIKRKTVGMILYEVIQLAAMTKHERRIWESQSAKRQADLFVEWKNVVMVGLGFSLEDLDKFLSDEDAIEFAKTLTIPAHIQ